MSKEDIDYWNDSRLLGHLMSSGRICNLALYILASYPACWTRVYGWACREACQIDLCRFVCWTRVVYTDMKGMFPHVFDMHPTERLGRHWRCDICCLFDKTLLDGSMPVYSQSFNGCLYYMPVYSQSFNGCLSKTSVLCCSINIIGGRRLRDACNVAMLRCCDVQKTCDMMC